MKLNYKRTFFVGLAFLSISSFWQMYDNIIPLILQNTFHLNEVLIGAIMALDNVLAVGGSWMVPPALVEAGDWDAITRLCQQSVAASGR